MGVAQRTRKFALTKRVIGRRDARLQTKNKPPSATKPQSFRNKKDATDTAVKHIPQAPSSMFFESNEALGPPYHIILDTNFFSHAIRAKVDILPGLMDLLLAVCVPCVTECTIAELEKLGPRYRLALQLAKDDRWRRLSCSHTGTYVDDCIVSTVMKHRCYLVATNDKQLRQRLRKIPGVPLVAVGRGKLSLERLPGIAA